MQVQRARSMVRTVALVINGGSEYEGEWMTQNRSKAFGDYG